MNIKKILEIIAEKEKDYNFNDYIANYIKYNAIKLDELSDITELTELEEYLQELDENGDITNADVIYSATAIEYLKENDPGLAFTIELASDMGYELKNINSELLASILKTENNKDDYQEFISEVIKELE